MSIFTFLSRKRENPQLPTNINTMLVDATKAEEKSNENIQLKEELNTISSKVTEASHILYHQLERIDFFENHLDDILTSSNAAIDYLLREWDKKIEEWNVTVLSEETRLWAMETSENFKTIVNDMENLADKVSETVHFSSMLQEQSKEMSKAVEYISYISESTKILSLNASIEAARAGEYGRSFGVVANEVRKLAENSKQATADILAIIHGIQTNTEKSVEMFSNSDETINNQLSKMQQLNVQIIELDDRSKEMVALTNKADSYMLEQKQRVFRAVNKLEVIRLNIVSLKRMLHEQREALQKVLQIFGQPIQSTRLKDDTIQSVYESFYTYLKNEEVENAVYLMKSQLEKGRSPEHLINDVLERAVLKLGAEQIDRTVPLSEIYINSRIIQQSLDILIPSLNVNKREEVGTIVIGNAFGDYHALGKKIISSFLKLGGFKVIDLGMSVDNMAFIEAVKRENADIVAISALILHSAEEIKYLRELLNKHGLAHVKILVGGAPFLFDPDLYKTYNADATASTGIEAIRVAKKLLHLI